MRRQSRELALKLLFSSEFQEIESWQDIEFFSENFTTSPDSEEYAQKLFWGVKENHAEIDEKISGVVQNWSIKRLSKVDKIILQIACYELLHCADDVPAKVVINEAIEIAKRFGAKDSPGFINGVLDKIAQK